MNAHHDFFMTDKYDPLDLSAVSQIQSRHTVLEKQHSPSGRVHWYISQYHEVSPQKYRTWQIRDNCQMMGKQLSQKSDLEPD